MGCVVSNTAESGQQFHAIDVEKAINLSRSAMIANQKRAVSTMTKIASSDDKWRLKLVEGGCLDTVIGMLRSNSKSVQVMAAKLIAKLALVEANRIKITQEGAIVPICEILHDLNIRTKLVAVEALYQLAQYSDARPKIVAEGVILHMMPLLESESLEVEMAGLALVAKLSQHVKCHVKMVKDGILGPIFEVLRSSMKSVKHKRFAALAVSELCTHVENHRQIALVEYKNANGENVKIDGIKTLVDLTGHYAEDIRTYAAIGVGRLAENSLLRKPLVQNGAIGQLIAMLKVNKIPMQRNASYALKLLSQDLLNQVRIIKEGALPPLLKLARCGNDNLEASASLTIAILASNNINRPIMLAGGAFKPLIYNARFGHTQEIKTACMQVLAALFHTNAYRKKELIRRVCEKFKALLIRKKQAKGGIVGKKSQQTQQVNDPKGLGQEDADDGASQLSSDDEK